MSRKTLFTFFFFFTLLGAKAGSPVILVNTPGGFPLSATGVNTVVYCDSTEQEVVRIAARLFCSDVERVTGRKPRFTQSTDSLSEQVVIIGSIEHNRLIVELVKNGKLNVDQIRGGWERFQLQTLDAPCQGVQQALVIAGSDRRGTAYGAFEVSKAMGVSPWYWWADVKPQTREALYVQPVNYVSSEPTVRYRGIFINDEDFGLQQWSKYTFDPVQDIGPKSYEKVCELLLRLRANYLWPAMHNCVKPFNYYAENKLVADRYAIVMGSSHHEPILYNTHEWPYPTADWNAFTNMDKIMGELEKRLVSNGKYENVYTMGIRGTEDEPAAGGSTLDEKTAKLEQVIDRERGLLTKHVNPDIQKVPQVFWPYKEVTDLYNNRMNLPDDITLGWVDDNFGYVRQVSNPEEQARSGGSGVYYHLSYWGSPSDYLWIASTPPALIASELKKSATFGANRVWVINVGDIKPAEMLLNYCMDLAWDYNKWGTDNVREYLMEWSTFTFGKEFAESITGAYTKYFQLAQAAKPEHVNLVTFTNREMDERLAAYQEIGNRVDSVYAAMPESLKDAFFETVYYPIKCAGFMNQKFYYAQKSFQAAVAKDPEALNYSRKANTAYNSIQTLTYKYNTSIAGGKWNKVISANIKGLPVFAVPTVATKTDVEKEYAPVTSIMLSDGTFVAPMKYQDGAVFGDKAGKQTAATGGKAAYTFEMPKSLATEMYFYAKNPSLDEDSWFVTINGVQFIKNDCPTGDEYAWIKVWTGTLKQGVNTLVINQREPNAQIAAIKFAQPGVLPSTAYYVPQPDTIIPAWKFTTRQNASGYSWETIDGLTTSEKGVANTPLTLPSVAQAKDAPYLEQEVELSDSSFTLEVRCLPTSRLYEGRDLRIGVSIDDQEIQVFSMYQPYPTTNWEKNVLRGYVKKQIPCKSKNQKVKIRLYALDPGLVFDKILIYKEYMKQELPVGLKPNPEQTNDGVSFYPNPCKDQLHVRLDKFEGENVDLKLTDLSGRTLIHKKIKVTGGNEKVSLPVSELNSGVYILVLQGPKERIVRKVEKN